MPGAVPTGLGSGSAPWGKSAWTRFRSAMTRLRRANIAAIAASDSGSSTRGTPAQIGQGLARQVVLRRTQSAGHDDQLGPLERRPESGQMVLELVAQGRVERDRDSQRPKLRLSHWLLVSRLWPLTSSLPIEMISARIGGSCSS